MGKVYGNWVTGLHSGSGSQAPSGGGSETGGSDSGSGSDGGGDNNGAKARSRSPMGCSNSPSGVPEEIGRR